MIEKQLNHEEVMERKSPFQDNIPSYLFLDNVQLPHNLAGLFRLSDAFGMTKIIISGANEFIFSKKFRSIARTHEDNILYSVLDEIKGLAFLKEHKNNFLIQGIEYTNQSSPVHEIKKDRPTILVIGSEKHGISQPVLDLCEHTFHINMMGNISSLNVCTAAAIALHEYRRK